MPIELHQMIVLYLYQACWRAVAPGRRRRGARRALQGQTPPRQDPRARRRFMKQENDHRRSNEFGRRRPRHRGRQRNDRRATWSQRTEYAQARIPNIGSSIPRSPSSPSSLAGGELYAEHGVFGRGQQATPRATPPRLRGRRNRSPQATLTPPIFLRPPPRLCGRPLPFAPASPISHDCNSPPFTSSAAPAAGQTPGPSRRTSGPARSSSRAGVHVDERRPSPRRPPG